MKRRKKKQKPERKESGTDRKVSRWRQTGNDTERCAPTASCTKRRQSRERSSAPSDRGK